MQLLYLQYVSAEIFGFKHKVILYLNWIHFSSLHGFRYEKSFGGIEDTYLETQYNRYLMFRSALINLNKANKNKNNGANVAFKSKSFNIDFPCLKAQNFRVVDKKGSRFITQFIIITEVSLSCYMLCN